MEQAATLDPKAVRWISIDRIAWRLGVIALFLSCANSPTTVATNNHTLAGNLYSLELTFKYSLAIPNTSLHFRLLVYRSRTVPRMASVLPVKMEHAPGIKPDPDGLQPTQPIDEDDDFEDTGELELPQQAEHAWLLRVPRVLHEQWAPLNQDQEICVGKIRRNKRTGRLKMILDPNLPFHEKVERDYDLHRLAANTKNTYIFSEKDLPGYKKGGKNKQGADSNETLGANKTGVDKTRRFHPFRRTIPKQTRLGHIVTTELNCMPEENETTRAIRKQRQIEEEQNRAEVKLDMEEGYAPEVQSFMNLNRKKDVPGIMRTKPPKSRPQENKAARMPRNELLDRLFECFAEFKYWSMRALRERLHQPEAYLKENLDAIAELVRAGQFNGNYKLKDDATKEAFNEEVKDEAAPEESELEALSGGDELDDDPSEL